MLTGNPAATPRPTRNRCNIQIGMGLFLQITTAKLNFNVNVQSSLYFNLVSCGNWLCHGKAIPLQLVCLFQCPNVDPMSVQGVACQGRDS